MIKRVEYLDLVPTDILYEIIFSLSEKIIDKDGVVLDSESSDLIDAIYFI